MKLTAVALMFQVLPIVFKHLKKKGDLHPVGNKLLSLIIDAEEMFVPENAAQKRQHVLDKAKKQDWREEFTDEELAEIVDYLGAGVGHSLDDEFEFALITCTEVAAANGANLAASVVRNNTGISATAAMAQKKLQRQAELAQGVSGAVVKP